MEGVLRIVVWCISRRADRPRRSSTGRPPAGPDAIPSRGNIPAIRGIPVEIGGIFAWRFRGIFVDFLAFVILSDLVAAVVFLDRHSRLGTLQRSKIFVNNAINFLK